MYFYPRSPCGERPGKVRVVEPGFVFLSTLSLRRATSGHPETRPSYAISIHALLAESDRCKFSWNDGKIISIHALLAESDHPKMSDHHHNTNFYPRSPCGERPSNFKHTQPAEHFYPRSPCGERQTVTPIQAPPSYISIHALLAESDCQL